MRELVPLRPLGAEICFNATDDNANALIDEGCDVRQGEVHFMIAWTETDADVDLVVMDPAQSTSSAEAPSALGLVLSDDCPRAGGACSGRAFESVSLDADAVPPGVYRASVRLEASGKRTNLSDRPLVVRFGARLPGVSVGREIAFWEVGQETTFAFSVSAPSVSPERAVGSARDGVSGQD